MSTSFTHNPGQPHAGHQIREKAKAYLASAAVESHVVGALIRLVGGDRGDYTLHLDGADAVTETPGNLYVALYDLAGSFAAVTIKGRGVSGSITAVCDDLRRMKGALGRVLKATENTFDVGRWRTTLTVVEESYGVGRIEWSVNQ